MRGEELTREPPKVRMQTREDLEEKRRQKEERDDVITGISSPQTLGRKQGEWHHRKAPERKASTLTASASRTSGSRS